MQNLLRFGVIILALIYLNTCEKDSLEHSADTTSNSSMVLYESFAPKLQKAVSLAINDPAFKAQVIAQTSLQALGDTEALLKDILSTKDNRYKDLLIGAAEYSFTKEELNEYLLQYPSTIIGVRGDYSSWEAGSHTPPVAYVPSSFDEKSASISGSLLGEPTLIPLNRPFTAAVLAIRLSERHDRQGVPIRANGYNTSQVPNTKSVETRPGDGNGGGDGEGGGASRREDGSEGNPDCISEASCSAFDILTFSATPLQGCIQLSYMLNNPLEVCERYIRVEIERLNPDGSIERINRFGHTEESFFDCDVNPGVTYFYRVRATIQLPHDQISIQYDIYGNIVVVSQEESPECLYVSHSNMVKVVAPEFGERLQSFHGRNLNNTTIEYSWEPPFEGGWEYKLSYWNGSSYEQEAIIATTPEDPLGFEYSYTFEYPENDRGELVKMLIQYRPGTGAWQGDYYDKTYGSFRNPGEPLYFYGVELSFTELYELGIENPINGNPEFRILTVQGTVDGLGMPRTSELQNAYVLTYRCPGTDFYYPNLGPHQIINWDNSIIGSAITVFTYESDEGEVTIEDGTEVATEVREFSGQVGFKQRRGASDQPANPDDDTIINPYNPPFAEGSVGISDNHREAEKITKEYPVSLIELGVDVIYYHEARMLERGNRFFGTQPASAEQSICDIFADF